MSWIIIVSRIPPKKETERGGEAGTLAGFLYQVTQALPAAAPMLSTFVHIWPYSSASFPKAVFILLLFSALPGTWAPSLGARRGAGFRATEYNPGVRSARQPCVPSAEQGGDLARAQQAQKPSMMLEMLRCPLEGVILF